ncbi:MAG: hypothetical protein R3F19_31970 [Verrucomicrobiales bacterium]
MATKLTWDDLLIQPVDSELAARCLKEWDFILDGRFAPVSMSKFGDWFLRRPDGSTDELSVIEGTLTKIADSPDDFVNLVNRQDWQEEHLLPSKSTISMSEDSSQAKDCAMDLHHIQSSPESSTSIKL